MLARKSPESQGLSSRALIAFLDATTAANIELHSLMVLRRGVVVAEGWWTPYGPDRPHMLFSLSKSFTSSAVGMAVAEGRLSVEDKVVSFFPDDLPDVVSDHLAAMSVRDLLIMGTGHETEPPLRFSDGNWVRDFLAHPVEHAPGTKFLYNTPATYIQAAIIEKITGESLLDYLTPRLFEPLGIESPTWQRSPQGICTGGFGLSVRTEDIAKFGQLYLQEGEWEGRQLIDREWVRTATSKQIDNGSDPERDWTQGYGYQFWRSRHDAYRGDGAFGQYCVVVPGQDLVVAITAGIGDMQVVLNQIWDILLPALSDEALEESEEAQELLARLRTLEIARPAGSIVSPRWPLIDSRTFEFEANDADWDSFRLTEVGDSLSIEWNDQTVLADGEGWKVNDSRHPYYGPLAATYRWCDPDTLVVRVAYVETPFVETYTLAFADESVEVSRDLSASFGPTKTGPHRANIARP